MIINRCLSISFLTIIFISFAGCSSKLEEIKYVFIGDSIIAGRDIEYYFPYLNIENLGIDGAKIRDLDFNFWSSDLKQTALISLVGTNDIAALKESTLSSISLGEIVSSYKLGILKSNASKIIVISILPRNGANAEIINQQRIKVNEELNNMTKDIPHVIFLDVFNNFIGQDGQLDMNYSADGIHLNSYDYELLSAKLSAIL